MAYIKTDWKNRVVEKPRTFTIQENADGTVTLIPAEGVIHEEGTPVAAAQMNKIEQGIADAFTEIDTKVDKVAGKALSTNDYTTAEKNKLAGIQAGAQVNAVTSVVGKTGAVTLVKGDVGLGSVENYGIATTAEAQAGTSNVKYMTPLRVKEAINKETLSTARIAVGSYTGTGGSRTILVGFTPRIVVIDSRNVINGDEKFAQHIITSLGVIHTQTSDHIISPNTNITTNGFSVYGGTGYYESNRVDGLYQWIAIS